MKKAQTVTIDLLLAVGLLVVIAVVTSTTLLATTQPPVLSADAQALAGALFAPYPTNWTQENVITPGVVVNYRFNETLFDQLTNVENLHALVGISNNYFINTTYAAAGTPPANASNVYSVTRYAAYNNTITPIEVIIWRE